jgi:hypothetical protein
MSKQTEGYIVVAQNNDITDYVACARVLAKSLKLSGDHRPVTLCTDSLNYPGLEIFDTVEILISDQKKDDQWRLQDDWQIFELSPYDRTFKIEADVLVTRSLDNWWQACSDRDLVVAVGTRDFRQKLSPVRYYRQVLDRNCLPDVYNGLTYFTKSDLSKQFFKLVKQIFNDWTEINGSLQSPSSLTNADTDTVYAIAASVLGVENTTLPTDLIQWVHMKSKINGTTEDWTQELCWELVGSDFRINTVSQLWPVHYHVKQLAQQLEPYYDKQLNNR